LRAWRTAYGSAIGTAHVRNGAVCQDAGCCAVVRPVDGPEILVASVADGAGSAPQSEHGARLAVEAFQRDFAAAAQGEAGLDAIGRDFVLQWLADTQAAIQTLATASGYQAKDYACTFLGAVITDQAAVYVQIGDGAIVTDDADGFRAIFWPQHGEFANSTFFLTMEDAAAIIQVERRDGAVQELAMFSDGLERLVLDMTARTVHAPALRPIFGWLASTEPAPGGGPSAVVTAYLNSANVNRRTDDDKTLIMATRAPPAP
jgi:hypothetical protein